MYWNHSDNTEEVKTTWDELSTYQRFWLKSITCSIIDRPERGPICYATDHILQHQHYVQDEQDQEAETDEEDPQSFGPGLKFIPLKFQSIFYIQTRKGSIRLSKTMLP